MQDIYRRPGPLPFILHDEIDVGRLCPGVPFPLDAFKALAQTHAQGDTVDALTQSALNRAKAANPAITPNVDGAIFQAYKQ